MSTFGKRWSVEIEGVVSTWNDEIADKFLVTVHYEIAAERGRFFAFGDKLGRGEVLEVASGGLRVSSDIDVECSP